MDILDTVDEICKKYGLYKKSGLHVNTFYYMIRPEFTHFVVKTFSNKQCGKLCYFVEYAYHDGGYLNDKNEYVSPMVYDINLSDKNWKKTLEFNIECIQEQYKKLLFEKKLDAMNKDFE